MSKTPKMDIFEATMTAEGACGYETSDPERYIQAWQTLIDTGTCWTLQGWFGRMARDFIEAGLCYPASVPESKRTPIDPVLVEQMMGW
jgi:hypothetical protein